MQFLNPDPYAIKSSQSFVSSSNQTENTKSAGIDSQGRVFRVSSNNAKVSLVSSALSEVHSSDIPPLSSRQVNNLDINNKSLKNFTGSPDSFNDKEENGIFSVVNKDLNINNIKNLKNFIESADSFNENEVNEILDNSTMIDNIVFRKDGASPFEKADSNSNLSNNVINPDHAIVVSNKRDENGKTLVFGSKENLESYAAELGDDAENYTFVILSDEHQAIFNEIIQAKIEEFIAQQIARNKENEKKEEGTSSSFQSFQPPLSKSSQYSTLDRTSNQQTNAPYRFKETDQTKMLKAILEADNILKAKKAADDRRQTEKKKRIEEQELKREIRHEEAKKTDISKQEFRHDSLRKNTQKKEIREDVMENITERKEIKEDLLQQHLTDIEKGKPPFGPPKPLI